MNRSFRFLSVALPTALLIVFITFALRPGTIVGQEEKKASESESTPAALGFTMKTLDGEEKNLADYQGKVVVMVNVASRCGLTPQYGKLQELHEKYSEKGLSILGFPCNQFGGQEPGTAEEIKTFCKDNYDVGFDMFAKINVNGEDQCGLYAHLNALELEPQGAGDISWNFEKFLLDREGNVVGRFGPRTDPTSDEFVKAIETALGKADE